MSLADIVKKCAIIFVSIYLYLEIFHLNRGSKINKKDNFLRFDLLPFKETFFLYVFENNMVKIKVRVLRFTHKQFP